MNKVYWLDKDVSAIVSVCSWPSVLNNISNPTEEHIRAANGRVEINKPPFDSSTHKLGAIEVVDGELFWPVVAYTHEELLELDAANKNAAIAQIWQAAHDYEYAQISGTAVGLLTAGVLQSLPKSLAVQAWCGSIWNIYYTNKAIIEGGGDFSESMLDYSSVGDIPHTVPELREEIGM